MRYRPHVTALSLLLASCAGPPDTGDAPASGPPPSGARSAASESALSAGSNCPPDQGLFEQGSRPAFGAPPRVSFAAVTVGDRVYILGGHTGPEHVYPPSAFLAAVQYFDLTEGRWHEAAPRNFPAEGFGVAAAGPFIYAFGGFAYDAANEPTWQSLDVIERYDVRADRWEVIGHMPTRRSSNVVVSVGGKAYLIGGWDSTPRSPGSAEGKFLDTIDVFDLQTETITSLATRLPKLRRAFAGWAWDGAVILAGGLGPSADAPLLDDVTRFDPASETWSALPPLPHPTFAPGIGVSGGALFVFGGYTMTSSTSGDYVDAISMLQPGSRWLETGRHLREPKGFPVVVALPGDTLGLLGGQTNQGGNSALSTFETFRFGAGASSTH